MVVKAMYLVCHIMYIDGKIEEVDLKENQKRFDEALDINMTIGKYFEIIVYWIQYEDNAK